MAATKPSAKTAVTAGLTAVEPISHDGVQYAPGEALPEMPADQAQALLASGAAKTAD